MMKTRMLMLTAIIVAIPAWAGVIVEADFNDGTLGPMVESQYGQGEYSVGVAPDLGVGGTPCARISNEDPGALGALKYTMRYRAGHVYTISFMARTEGGTADVTAYLDAGDWKANYPGGYAPAVTVGEEWQEITWTNLHQQGRSYLANVRNNSETPVLVDDIVIRESDAPVAINYALAQFGGEPSADSIYGGYRLEPINDGLQIHVGPDFTRRATVTAESADPHWVQVTLAGPRPISRVVVYWAVEDGNVYTSRRFDVQLLVDDAWQTVAEVEEAEATAFSTVQFEPQQATAVRMLQPSGGGPAQRPNLMWVGEVEAY